MGGLGILVVLAFYALIAYILYWLIRLGVRHGIRDADDRRDNPRLSGGFLPRNRPGLRRPPADGPAE
jgi:hypothetical protein